MNEIWKDIPLYEGYYQVSNLGRIKSLKNNGYILNPYKPKNRYIPVVLCINGKRNMFLVHRLVAFTFLDNPQNKPYVNHKNGDKHDNKLCNLEWVTPKENDIHASLNFLKAFGQRNSQSKLTNELVLEIRSKYKPRKYTNRMLAKEYNMSYHEIQLITNRTRWRHI